MLLSRMEKASNHANPLPPVNGSDVSSFMTIAQATAIREIIICMTAAVLHCKNVVNRIRDNPILLVNTAIFTAFLRSRDD